MVNFLDYEGTDPSSKSREAAEAITAARKEAEAKGIKPFLFHSASTEEFDQRAQFGEVSDILAEVADKYLGSPDERAKLLSALRREFVAQQPRSPQKAKDLAEELTHPGTIRGHESLDPDGTEKSLSTGGFDVQIVNEPGDPPKERAQNWKEKYKKAEKETVELDSGDVEIEKGKLTRDVGGKPSENMDKVRELAEKGNKGAQFYLNVLSTTKEAASPFTVCPSCDGHGSYVNPSIDSQGLTSDDFDEDEDFADDYKSGVYDVTCSQCQGDRVVPRCDKIDPNGQPCDNPAEAKPQDSGFGVGESRGRSSDQHYDKCYEHLDEDPRAEIDDLADMHAEMAAERAMGA